MKLHIGNIHEDVDEKELKDLFSDFTSFMTCTLVKDKSNGKSRGFGFVEFEKKEDSDSAMKKFDGHAIRGMNLKVNEANIKNKEPSRPSGLF